MSKEVWTIVAAFLTAFLTAALGGAGVLLQEWRQKRDDRHRRKQARIEATEMISFIEKWVQTQQLTCSAEDFEDVKKKARQKLERVYYSLIKVDEAKRPVEERSFLQRALLLYKPSSFGALVLHLIFYMLGTILLLWEIIGVALIIVPVEAKGQLTTMSETIFGLIVVNLLCIAPALAVRAWAVVIDKKHRKSQLDMVSASPVASSSARATTHPIRQPQ
ncbi:MAG: hypothetical protein QOG71_3891 [Pyrinomonadaceae bacterium]|nr:hypothetical protein [Pyrinomonadaceae bacterium]